MRAVKPYHFQNADISIKNRILLAPMTNKQSYDDGRASEDEMRWLEARAAGGFGALISCAAHVSLDGQGWQGEMGIFSDELKSGLTELCQRVHKFDAPLIVQLYHGGLRSPKSLTGQTPKAPSSYPSSEDKPDGCDALSLDEISSIQDAFVAAAKRAHDCGFKGVELHGAHGYLIHQFLDPSFNQREDNYGGSLENRSRFLLEIARRIRTELPQDFLVGIRFSPLAYEDPKTVNVKDIMKIVATLNELKFDFIHYSVWNFSKPCDDAPEKGQRLVDLILPEHPKSMASMVAGGFWELEDVESVLEMGADFIALGRLAIAYPDWPKKIEEDASFTAKKPPYSRQTLKEAALGEKFIDYMARWPDFVEKSENS